MALESQVPPIGFFSVGHVTTLCQSAPALALPSGSMRDRSELRQSRVEQTLSTTTAFRIPLNFCVQQCYSAAKLCLQVVVDTTETLMQTISKFSIFFRLFRLFTNIFQDLGTLPHFSSAEQQSLAPLKTIKSATAVQKGTKCEQESLESYLFSPTNEVTNTY